MSDPFCRYGARALTIRQWGEGDLATTPAHDSGARAET
jgi:hypothetical protein